jgi:hypothetical protein
MGIQTDGGKAMNIIDTKFVEDTTSDPQMLIVFLHYALEDVRKLSERSAVLLEQAISALANESVAIAPPQVLS